MECFLNRKDIFSSVSELRKVFCKLKKVEKNDKIMKLEQEVKTSGSHVVVVSLLLRTKWNSVRHLIEGGYA